MSGAVADSLSELLAFEKDRYFNRCKENGGTAKGFRRHVTKEYERDKLKFDSLMFQGLMEASTRCWERPPRNRGPDLFAVDGDTVPEILTRKRKLFDFEDDADEEETFEKVHQKYATVNDLYEDATIKMRKAAQAGASRRKSRERYATC